eukprot:1160874-Pelagomonas_calceolata.AAC.6
MIPLSGSFSFESHHNETIHCPCTFIAIPSSKIHFDAPSNFNPLPGNCDALCFAAKAKKAAKKQQQAIGKPPGQNRPKEGQPSSILKETPELKAVNTLPTSFKEKRHVGPRALSALHQRSLLEAGGEEELVQGVFNIAAKNCHRGLLHFVPTGSSVYDNCQAAMGKTRNEPVLRDDGGVVMFFNANRGKEGLSVNFNS